MRHESEGTNILGEILARTRADVRERQLHLPLSELRARIRDQSPPRDFRGALRRPPGTDARRSGPVRVVAEVKKASPSKGILRPDFAPVELATAYAAAGADAISVLTDTPFFQGSLAHLASIRGVVDLPLLRKDFHVEPYQLWEARAFGADAVLLIVGTLGTDELQGLLGLSRELGLSALVEVHNLAELETALACRANLLGVNNRDLRSFQVSLETTFALLPGVPSGAVLVSESGISRPEEVARLGAAGVDAVLVGEGLLRQADVGRALRDLVGAP